MKKLKKKLRPKDKSSKGMDAKEIFREISQRDALAENYLAISELLTTKKRHLMKLRAYGVRKLGLSCKRGHEESVLHGYLAAAKLKPEYAYYSGFRTKIKSN